MRRDREFINRFIENVFKVDKGKLRLRERDNEFQKAILNVMYGYRSKKIMYIGEDEFYSKFLIGFMKCLESKSDLKEYSFYTEDEVSRKVFIAYLGIVLKSEYMVDEERGEVIRKIDGRRVTDKPDFQRIDDRGGDSLEYEIDLIYGIEETESSEFKKSFLRSKEDILTRNQLRIYNSLKEDFMNDRFDIQNNGYKNQEEYLNSKGISRDSYRNFKDVLRTKEDVIEEGVIGVEDKLKEIDVLINNEELSDLELRLMISKVISKYYNEDEGFEVIVTSNLSKEEKIEVVRSVKYFNKIGIKLVDGKCKIDANLYEEKILSKGIIYKVIDNVYNSLDKVNT